MKDMTDEKLNKMLEGKPEEEKQRILALVQKLSVPISKDDYDKRQRAKLPPKFFKRVIREHDEDDLEFWDKLKESKDLRSGSGFYSQRTQALS